MSNSTSHPLARRLFPCLCRPLHLLVAALTLLGGCQSQDEPDPNRYRQLNGEIYGTHYRITYLGERTLYDVQRAVQRELDRIDWVASVWKPESELMLYNRAEDKEAFELSPELDWLLQRSEEIKQWTGGAFDVRYDGQQADLSGIAKGYAVDRVSDLLAEQFGIESSLVDIGGEIKVRGPGPKGEHWKVGIYLPAPANPKGVETPTLDLRDTSIATSGTTFKGYHLIDPRTGEAVGETVLSVSIIHPSNTTADALATALYIMGPDEGLAWACKHAVHALYLLEDGSIREHRPDQATNK